MTYTKHARVGFVTEECEYSAGFCRVFHLFVRIVVDKDAIYKRNLKTVQVLENLAAILLWLQVVRARI